MNDTSEIHYDVLARKLIALIGSPKPKEELITEIVLSIQKETGVESTGLRLQDGLDFPYYFTKGFSQDFVEKEMNLCAVDRAGALIRGSDGNPVLECLCGRVISGQADFSLPFFTECGSFCTNCTSSMLANTTEKERLVRMRNCCLKEGYESIALIPIKTGNTTHGLLQLNDRRKNRFTDETIAFLEEIGSIIDILFSFVQAQLTDETETLKGFLPICCQCKKIRKEDDSWMQIEEYIRKHSTNTEFTHTYCPECYQSVIDKLH